MKKLLFAGLIILLSGCAVNPFSKFYYDLTNGQDLTKLSHITLLKKGQRPLLYKGVDKDEDRIKMLENNYVMVGYSSFNAGNVNENDVFLQAEKVHATAVVLYSQYTNTVSGTVPLTLPSTQTTKTNISGNVYGSGGYANYSGYAKTTKYGTKTTYIPYNVRRYDYGATYWVQRDGTTFGLILINIDADLRAKIQSNKGMLIEAVIKDSPAFYSDIFRGDIIKRIGSIDIYGIKNYEEALKKYAGMAVKVIILRSGKLIEKEVVFNKRA
jgi:hypothetical protein